MIGALVAYLSMDICFRLIAAGVVANSFNVVAMTGNGVSPIVVTLDKAHGFQYPFHGVLTGSIGNTNANGIWQFEPVPGSDVQVALAKYSPQGTHVDSSGNAAWTGGGQVQIALPQGRVLLGRRYMGQNLPPPRIVFIPTINEGFSFDPYGGIIPTGVIPSTVAAITSEQQTMALARQVATERTRFEIHCWGATNPPDPDFGDFDATQALVHQVIQSLFNLVPGMDVVRGGWLSQREGEATMTTRGHEYVLMASIDQPVTDSPLTFLGPGVTAAEFNVNLDGADSGDASIFDVQVST